MRKEQNEIMKREEEIKEFKRKMTDGSFFASDEVVTDIIDQTIEWVDKHPKLPTTTEERVAQVIDAIDGMELMDAVDIIGEAITNCKSKHLILVPMYYIGKIMEETHASSALLKINDDGSLSFTIASNGVKQDIF